MSGAVAPPAPATGQRYGPRLLAGVRIGAPALTLREHIELHGPRPTIGSGLIDLVETSGLHGRGGAGFPSAVKLATLAGRRRPICVINAVEGEPASRKDGFLLRQTPHLVLDGAVLAAEAIGADRVELCVGRDAGGVVEALDRALAQRAGERRGVRIRVHELPRRYVSGEETAIVSFLNGGPARPTSVPPRPYERGVDGRPTLVQNAETVAHMALIARRGADWFRELGTRETPGTALVTVAGAVDHPGVYEIGLGTPLRSVVAVAGGSVERSAGVLVGGYFGSWIGPRQATAVTLDEPSLRNLGASLGAGLVAVFPEGTCGLAQTAYLLDYLAGESAGQCGPCVHGLAAIARETRLLAQDGRQASIARLRRWSSSLVGRGACRHPDGAERLLGSALRVFAGEIDVHSTRGRCSAALQPSLLPVPRPPDERSWR